MEICMRHPPQISAGDFLVDPGSFQNSQQLKDARATAINSIEILNNLKKKKGTKKTNNVLISFSPEL